jgi:tellurite resistance protein TehA-like permease
MRQRLIHGLELLNPAYFAMVMATGIVSIACFQLNMASIARLLACLNAVSYIILWALYLARVCLFPSQFFLDLIDHRRGVGFFTVIAGTCVFGSQLSLIYGMTGSAMALWIAGIVLWFAINYSVFTAFTVKQEKPPLEVGINGGWLVAVVATQSVSILGELVLKQIHPYEEWVHLFSLSFWLWGGMLYIWLISLIFYRYTFFKFQPSDLMPPYWINMGAMAISTLAGGILIGNAGQSRLLDELIPFLKGLTFMFWATATWWIPMLLILGFWRHVVKRFPLAYDPLFWGAVFPLGMYTACTWKLANVTQLPFLLVIPRYFIFVALGAWCLTFIGLVRRLVSILFLVEKPNEITHAGQLNPVPPHD